MRGYDKLLVPIDFSEPTREIVESALRVLADGGTLVLLHVVEWLPTVTESTFGVYAHRKDIEKFKKLAHAKLTDLGSQTIASTGADAKCEIKIAEGKPATSILRALSEVQPDLVVMGTHGRSRLDHLLIGSVAERVVRKAPCSVLLVRYEPEA